MHLDIEKLARDTGQRAFRTASYKLQEGDYIMSLDDLKCFAAVVLEESARVASQHDHPGAGNAYSTAASRIANQLQIMSNQLKGNHD